MKYPKHSPEPGEVLEDGAFDALGKVPYSEELKKSLPNASFDDVRRGYIPGGES